jgi:O-acetyl-ADP-ribose deacetylase (regulator of RNase III)
LLTIKGYPACGPGPGDRAEEETIVTIEYVAAGSILDDPSNVLACPVNCQPGVMGAGLARTFAARWPALKAVHGDAVRHGSLHPGQGHLVWLMGEPARPDPSGVYLLPTKDDWREPSRIEWVRDGLAAMGRDLAHATGPDWGDRAVRSVAIPALGAGLGGLPWAAVYRLVMDFCADHPAIDWRVYGPKEVR